jgi:murein DD-endopeptidase MepM/ murein hydrolase activator NlpD
LKQHTLILIPHARAKFRKWRFTTAQACFVLAPLALLTLCGLLVAGLYFGSSFDSEQLQQIKEENAALRTVNEQFETGIRDLQNQLKSYQQRVDKLAIVAGLTDLAPTTEPGIGGKINDPAPSTEAALASLQDRIAGLGNNLELVQQGLEENRLRLSSMPTVAPVKGILTSGYGNRRDPFSGRLSLHEGIDIVAPAGREVRAPGDGVVVKAARESSFGLVVYLSHGYGLTTVYGHLSATKVTPGQKVRRGDLLGLVGSTGRSTGNHLHYEVRLDGTTTNPLAYILDDIAP